MARPAKLTPKVIETLCEKLALGMTYDGACGAARISYQTFNRWHQTGSKLQLELDTDPTRILTPDEDALVSFVTKIHAAEAQAEEDFTTIVYNEASRDSQHAWKWLQTRRSKDYMPKQAIEHQGEGGGPFKLVVEYVNKRS